MKIRADEHISPKLIRAVQSIALSVGWELTHVRDFNSARTADETWIPRFVAEGGQAILSADRKIMARPHQLNALIDGRLIGVFLPSKWAEARGHAQAAHLLWWWPRIEAAISSSKVGQCWRVPYDFGEGAVEEIKISRPARLAKGTG
ncbi:MAG TPA: hypothetical protein VK446_04790 [Methylocystis sp.]|nr:hypothetical protein [Methylocystis sp.]